MKRLIINADDFGYSKEITLAIKEASEHGLLTSTSLIVNKDYSGPALDLVREIKDVSVGIHFNLDDGKPLCSPEQVRTLVNEQGQFYDGRTFRARLFLGKIRTSEIYRELEAQLMKFLGFGIQPSHIDFHHHLHLYYPILEVALQVAKDFNITRMRTVRLYRIYRGNGFLFNFDRWRKTAMDLYRNSLHGKIKKVVSTPDFLLEPKITGENGPSLEAWIKTIQSLRNEDVFELCCHPGYSPGEFEVTNREIELKILKSEHLRGFIETQNIKPITYDKL